MYKYFNLYGCIQENLYYYAPFLGGRIVLPVCLSADNDLHSESVQVDSTLLC